MSLDGAWEVVARAELGRAAGADYAFTSAPGDEVSLRFNGREVEITYARGPEFGVVTVLVDGAPALDEDDEPLTIDGYNAALRYEERENVDAGGRRRAPPHPADHRRARSGLHGASGRRGRSRGAAPGAGEQSGGRSWGSCSRSRP